MTPNQIRDVYDQATTYALGIGQDEASAHGFAVYVCQQWEHEDYDDYLASADFANESRGYITAREG